MWVAKGNINYGVVWEVIVVSGNDSDASWEAAEVNNGVVLLATEVDGGERKQLHSFDGGNRS